MFPLRDVPQGVHTNAFRLTGLLRLGQRCSMQRVSLHIASIRRKELELRVTLSNEKVYVLDPMEQCEFGKIMHVGQQVRVEKPYLGLFGRPVLKPV